MRTNIEIENEVLDRLKDLSGLKTKKDIVNTALREFLRILEQREILKYKGKIAWEGNLDEMREMR